MAYTVDTILGPTSLVFCLLVGGILSGVRRWWTAAHAAPRTPVPYEVTCGCGQVATGFRKPEHQVVRCARCSEELFVLPLSPLPDVAPLGAVSAEAPPPRPLDRLGPWALPIAAVTLTVAGLFVAYRLFFAARTEEQPPAVADGGPKGAAEAVAERLTAARKQVSQGNFRLALEELTAVRAVCERQPHLCSPAQRREGAQLYRQADLLADLLAEPLEEVLRHASGVQGQEWQAEFRHRYRGKAIALMADVRRDGDGGYEHVYTPWARGEQARLDLGDLALLRRLPLDPPQRLLFGGRLADVRREPGRGWVVRLEPDSGVLITAPGAAVACFYSPDEPEVAALLRRQEDWAAREPLEKPWRE